MMLMSNSIISPCRAEKQPPITHSILHGACEQRYICHQLRPKATGIVRQKARKNFLKDIKEHKIHFVFFHHFRTTIPIFFLTL